MKQKSLSVSGGCHYHCKKLSWDHYHFFWGLASLQDARVIYVPWLHKIGRWAKPCDATCAWMSTEALKFPQVCCCQGTAGWEQGAWMHMALGHLGTCCFPPVTIFWMVTDLLMRTEISHLRNSIGERGAWRITKRNFGTFVDQLATDMAKFDKSQYCFSFWFAAEIETVAPVLCMETLRKRLLQRPERDGSTNI